MPFDRMRLSDPSHNSWTARSRLSLAAVLGLAAALPGQALADGAAEARPTEARPTNARPTMVVLVAVDAPAGTASSFGKAGTDEIAARAALVRTLIDRGFSIVSTAGVSIDRVAGSEDRDEAGLADASAADLARKVGADIAVIVGFRGLGEGRIRGTMNHGGAASGRARLLDVAESRVLESADAKGFGFARTLDGAVEKALIASAKAIADELGRAASKRWAQPLAADNRLAISIAGAKSWASVSAVIRKLATTKGITSVHPREIRGSTVTLAVETDLSASKVAGAIRGARLFTGSLSTKLDGNRVIVSVRGDG